MANVVGLTMSVVAVSEKKKTPVNRAAGVKCTKSQKV
jgi:hypothetical protein